MSESSVEINEEIRKQVAGTIHAIRKGVIDGNGRYDTMIFSNVEIESIPGEDIAKVRVSFPLNLNCGPDTAPDAE